MVAPRATRSSSRLANANNNNNSNNNNNDVLAAPSSSPFTIRTDEEGGPPIRRSTRRAAMDAKLRIAEESQRDMERKRRSRRLRQLATTSPVARRQQQQQQHNNSPCMDLVDTPNSLKNNKGGALLNLGPLKSEEGAADLSQLEEFTCAICLDKPDTLVDLATISGCSHKFCFDCIDKWAETENKCPCCKQRFRTIDRVQNLPPTPASTSRSGGKRKRGSSSNNSGSNTRRRTGEAAASSTGGGEGATVAAAGGGAPRVNSRTVEDRTQQSVPPNISFALLESILNSAFMGPGRFTGGGRGQTTFRFPVPPSMAGNPGDLDDMAGMLRMILQDSMGPGPAGRVTIQVRTTTVPPPGASPSRASSSGGSPRRRNSSPHRRPTLFPNLSSPSSNNRSDNNHNRASSINSRSTRQLSSAGRRSRSRPARGSSNGDSGV